MVVTLLGSLDRLGWWTQWLLVSVFWWIAFEHRHRMLSLVLHERGEPRAARRSRPGRGAPGAPPARASARSARRDGRCSAPACEPSRSPSAAAGSPRTAAPATAPPSAGRRSIGCDARTNARRAPRSCARRPTGWRRSSATRRRASSAARAGPRIQTRTAVRLPALAARRARLDTALVAARAAGDRRRVVSLEARRARVEAERVQAADARGSGRGWLAVALPETLTRAVADRARTRLLDRAARAPAGALLRQPARAAPLAGLVGIRPAEYLRGSPAQQRAARVAIERQLRRRRELLDRAAPRAGAPAALRSRRGSCVTAVFSRR